jgi:formylglycine-generating enzyme required for sulfatase activity
MKLALIPAGTFLMGSPAGEADRSPDEGPQHEVTISRPFYLGVYPVTQEQYEQVMGTNPSWFSPRGGGSDKVRTQNTRTSPVESVSWEDAAAFCRKLSELPEEKRRGLVYRLPTEAEWEYACRGGASSSIPFYFGHSLSATQANFNNHLGRTTGVGSFPTNGFGLHEMHGNIWEWCQDWFDANYYANSPNEDPQGPQSGEGRVLRGGSWSGDAWLCRSALRYRGAPGFRYFNIGFRVALTVAPRGAAPMARSAPHSGSSLRRGG